MSLFVEIPIASPRHHRLLSETDLAENQMHVVSSQMTEVVAVAALQVGVVVSVAFQDRFVEDIAEPAEL